MTEKKSEPEFRMRWMTIKDIPEVMKIEGHSFDEHWTEEDMRHVLRQKSVIGMVVESGGVIAGFMIYELHEDRIHVLLLAVHCDFRRQGVGRVLLDRLKRKLSHRARGRSEITLHVMDRNLDAQLFYRDNGFRATGVKRQYYKNGDDAYVMRYSLTEKIRIQN